jgi:phosphoglucosamine mutase
MYYTLEQKCIGIMITASHNPYKDNGIKIVEDGYKITKNLSDDIERFIELNKHTTYVPSIKNTLEIDYSIRNLYINYLKSRMIKHKQKILFDGANGAYSYILKELFNENEIINCEPNGENINFKCGSTDLSSLIHELKVRKYDIGIAFDGDGDRIMVVDKYNRIYEGDFLTYIYALDLFKNGLLAGNTVVYTEIVNPGIINKLNSLGIYTIITEVGDHNISNALEREYVLGGESSGHIINKTHLPFGDGLSNALELIKILENNTMKLYEYSYEVKFYYSKSFNIYFEHNNFDISDKLREKINKFALKKKINLILRKSGTEKAIRVFIYQPSSKGMNKHMTKIVKMIKNV